MEAKSENNSLLALLGSIEEKNCREKVCGEENPCRSSKGKEEKGCCGGKEEKGCCGEKEEKGCCGGKEEKGSCGEKEEKGCCGEKEEKGCCGEKEEKEVISLGGEEEGEEMRVFAKKNEPQRNRGECVSKLKIEGMNCASCASTIQSKLCNVKGVKQVHVSYITRTAEVIHQNLLINPEEVRLAVEKIGFQALLLSNTNNSSSSIQEIELTFQIKPNSSLLETSLLESPLNSSHLLELCHTLSSLKGVLQVEQVGDVKKKKGKGMSGVSGVSGMSGVSGVSGMSDVLLRIKFDSKLVGIRELVENIEEKVERGEQGYRVILPPPKSGNEEEEEEVRKYKKLFVTSCFLLFPLLLIYILKWFPNVGEAIERPLGWEVVTFENLLSFLLSLPAQFYVGLVFHVPAFRGISSFNLNMDVLISLSMWSAFLYSIIALLIGLFSPLFYSPLFFDIPVSLSSFILLGRLLEALAQKKTSNALTSLMQLQTPYSTLLLLPPPSSSLPPLSSLPEKQIDTRLIQKGSHSPFSLFLSFHFFDVYPFFPSFLLL